MVGLYGDLFLTDGGIETTLIFHDGFELPNFAAFDLLKRDEERGLFANTIAHMPRLRETMHKEVDLELTEAELMTLAETNSQSGWSVTLLKCWQRLPEDSFDTPLAFC